MPNIMIVGGYGAVGSKIARQLADKPDNHVIVAGRNLDRAAHVARTIGGEARHIDLSDSTTWNTALESIDLAVVCIDQKDTTFLETLSNRGIDCVDVTAGDDFFQKAEALRANCAVVLSVGLAPGLSNLLAIKAAEGMEHIEAIEIGLLMGTGDEHGSGAIAWSTAQMFDPLAPHDDAMVDFGSDFGSRRAYFMDFADQHVLTRTMPGVKAVTRVAYDSALLTAALFWIGRRFAGNQWMQKLIERVSHTPTFGSDKCVLTVTAKGRIANQQVQRTAHFFGRKEAAVTAAMAVATTEDVLSCGIDPGIHHAHKALDSEAVFARIEKWGHGRFVIGPIVSSIRP